ncbi:MAG: N-acetyl-gamma-glutamyl-phosphate reductase [Ignavibacteriales bacterium]|nr:N-acetyl-gamma-glutamyl-phosphate reductase [Ignavibacteriales bacterium]
MISVGIIGGTGYTGKYIVKFINEHPNVSDFSIYANKSAGQSLHEVFPDLVSEVENQTVKNAEDLDLSHDVYFFALPHGESFKYVPMLIDAHKKVIDLGADFRLDNAELFLNTYKLDHTSPEFLKSKIYGLAEVADNYESTNLIANPGCYPTAALLSAIPLVKYFGENILSVSTVSYSGISGAGKKASTDLLFAENYNSVKAYNVGTHRHEVEIAQELNKYSNEIDYSLTTHFLPVFSGIYSTTIIHVNENVEQENINSIFNQEYSGKTFIRLRQTPPELKWVIGSNYCDINVKAAKNKIIVTAAIDNLIKGASGQAVQNMNKMYGWDEALGIKIYKEEFQNV